MTRAIGSVSTRLRGFLGLAAAIARTSLVGLHGEAYLGFPELGGYPHLLQEQGMVFRVFSSAMYLPRGSTGTDHAYLSRAYGTLNPPTNDHMCMEHSRYRL